MPVLTSQQRGTLETAVKQARKLAETGARNALRSLAVDHPEPFSHMSPDQRTLRNRLRHKARLLGDDLPATGDQQIDRLGYELAYENWHKMLFAKFLESNGLLKHPSGVAITMEECEELAREEGFIDKWDAAATYASKMLPAIFRTDDPLMQIQFAADDRIKLEAIIDALDSYIFTADDALGWVYQFWQSDAKAAINASGAKIDGAKLPAVTQLFTEPYMVHFLIDNTLGAWWVSRNPGVTPPVKFEYLRVPPASSRSSEFGNPTASSRSSEFSNPPASSWGNNLPLVSNESSDVNVLRQDGGGTVNFSYFNPYEEVDNIIGNLPHWRQEGKLYFVTFRAADSMPHELLKEWESEMETWKRLNPEPHTPEQKKEYYHRFPAKMQQYLDAGYGACHLKNKEIKTIVENALRFFDGARYILDEFVVSVNHVHVLVEPKGGYQLSDILHSWKSFTANEIHKLTGESGAFWQKESFDHLVRSEASLGKFREYIRKHNHSTSAIPGGDDNSVSAIPGGEHSSSVIPGGENKNLRQDARGTLFEGWPDKTSEVTSLDPCMGSGHFVASLFPVFVALRMYEEGLTKEEATDRVITENLHGLELDARCTQIAAFNLALTAWKFCGHYKELPEMNLACSGIAPKGKVEDWVKLVGNVPSDDKARMENGMRMLYDHFQLAPELGSLLDPSTIQADAFTASFEQLQPVLAKALEGEADKDLIERGVMAAGIAKAGEILAQKYTLQITNVPYLTVQKQGDLLAKYLQFNFQDSKNDLATAFLDKMLSSSPIGGSINVVIPQNWLFLPRYKRFRERLLEKYEWNILARLGSGAFCQIGGEVVKVVLFTISNFNKLSLST